MLTKMMVDEVTAHYASANAYLPGEIVITRDRTYGTRFWRFIKNADVAVMPYGTLVERVGSGTNSQNGIICVTASKPKTALLGVIQSSTSLAVGSYTFALCKGIGYGLTGTGVTAGAGIQSDGTSGRVNDQPSPITGPTAAALIGQALATGGGAGLAVLCDFDLL